MDSLETVNQILTRVLPEALHTRLAYLSGPSFAAEVSTPDLSPKCALWLPSLLPKDTLTAYLCVIFMRLAMMWGVARRRLRP